MSGSRASDALGLSAITQALHAAHSVLLITDPREDDNPIVWVNDHFCRFTGYSREEALGRNCRFLQGTDRDQPELAMIRQHIARGEACSAVLRNYRKDGTLFYNELYLSPIYEAGTLVHYLGVQNDVTARVEVERLKAEQEHERAVMEATEQEREQLGMDIHDGLGQVLSGLRMLVEVLRGELQDQAPDHVGAVERVLDLLVDAQLEARRIAQGLNPVDASPDGLCEALRALAEQMRATSARTIDVEAAIEPIRVVDRRQARHLYRIAQEALSNAVKHSQSNHIRLGFQRRAQGVCLSVDDDGTGLPADLLDWLNQDDAPHPAVAFSSGMGLFSMRFRAELIGARLAVRPLPERGTTIQVTLPRPDGVIAP